MDSIVCSQGPVPKTLTRSATAPPGSWPVIALSFPKPLSRPKYVPHRRRTVSEISPAPAARWLFDDYYGASISHCELEPIDSQNCPATTEPSAPCFFTRMTSVDITLEDDYHEEDLQIEYSSHLRDGLELSVSNTEIEFKKGFKTIEDGENSPVHSCRRMSCEDVSFSKMMSPKSMWDPNFSVRLLSW